MKELFNRAQHAPAYPRLRYMDIRLREFENILKYSKVNKEIAELGSSNVLDIGCGNAFTTLVLSMFFKKVIGIEHYGYDESQQLEGVTLTSSRAILSNHTIPLDARVVSADAIALPFRDNYFGAVYASNVFEHFKVPLRDTICSEIKRVLQPGGILIVIVPSFTERIMFLFNLLRRPRMLAAILIKRKYHLLVHGNYRSYWEELSMTNCKYWKKIFLQNAFEEIDFLSVRYVFLDFIPYLYRTCVLGWCSRICRTFLAINWVMVFRNKK